ncbi:hypothetical protein ACFY8B_26160 [Streptomyces sp. NPDC012751]|uniref:hypothetical protein n=1 Tax=unclassified Streptomyces TaxID=2593676 RepID=UPI0020A66FE6|nr:hypothetical protein [Streptomyces sp. NRRL S-31]
MKAQRVRRLFAASAAGVLLATGAAISTAGTASAATVDQVTTNRGCGGWWGGCGGFRNDFFGNGFRSGFGGTGVVVIVVR